MLGIPDAICWHEGMPLLPQHFQLQGVRAESLSIRHAAGAHPWCWGVNALEVDTAVLGEGLIRIQALSAVLSDGTVVDFDLMKDLPLELQLTEENTAGNTDLMIYLAVAPWRRSSGQLVPWTTRMRSLLADDIADLHSGESATAIKMVRPRLQLVTAQFCSDSVCLPLLRLSCEDRRYTRKDYQPPCPCITPQSLIGQRITELCALTRQKGEDLVRRLQLSKAEGKTSVSSELRFQLNAIWASLPSLQANLETGIAHPLALFLGLNDMAGSLASLAPEEGLPSFRPLQYEALLESFEPLLAWLTQRLKTLRGGYVRAPFTYEENRFHTHLKDRENVDQQLVIGLRMPAGTGPEAAESWLKEAVRGSASQIGALELQRGHGLKFQRLPRSEQVAYGVGESVQLFSLKARGEWFRADERLYLFVPRDIKVKTPEHIFLFDESTTD